MIEVVQHSYLMCGKWIVFLLCQTKINGYVYRTVLRTQANAEVAE